MGGSQGIGTDQCEKSIGDCMGTTYRCHTSPAMTHRLKLLFKLLIRSSLRMQQIASSRTNCLLCSKTSLVSHADYSCLVPRPFDYAVFQALAVDFGIVYGRMHSDSTPSGQIP